MSIVNSIVMYKRRRMTKTETHFRLGNAKAMQS